MILQLGVSADELTWWMEGVFEEADQIVIRDDTKTPNVGTMIASDLFIDFSKSHRTYLLK